MRNVSATFLLALATAALTGCHSVPPPTPLSQLNAQQQNGHVLFASNCSVCHNDRVSGPRNGPSLLGVFKKPALPSGAAATDERVTATVLHGRNNMPGFSGKLEQTDVDDILAYLHTL